MDEKLNSINYYILQLTDILFVMSHGTEVGYTGINFK
jgi:hypothetical protein